MTLAVVLAFLFLLSPIVGYMVVASDLPLQTKLWIGAVGVVALAIMPVILLLASGQ